MHTHVLNQALQDKSDPRQLHPSTTRLRESRVLGTDVPTGAPAGVESGRPVWLYDSGSAVGPQWRRVTAQMPEDRRKSLAFLDKNLRFSDLADGGRLCGMSQKYPAVSTGHYCWTLLSPLAHDCCVDASTHWSTGQARARSRDGRVIRSDDQIPPPSTPGPMSAPREAERPLISLISLF